MGMISKKIPAFAVAVIAASALISVVGLALCRRKLQVITI